MSAGPHVTVIRVLSTVLDSAERRIYTLRVSIGDRDASVRGWISKRPTGWEDDLVGRPRIRAIGDRVVLEPGEGLSGATEITNIQYAETAVARLRTVLSEAIRSVTESRHPIADIRERALAMDVAVSRWRAGLQAGSGVVQTKPHERARQILEAKSEFEVDVFQLPNGAEFAVGEANEMLSVQITPPTV